MSAEPAPHAWTTDGRWSHLRRHDRHDLGAVYHVGPGNWRWMAYAAHDRPFSEGVSPTTAGARHACESACGLITEEAPHDQAEGGDVGMSAPLGQVEAPEPGSFEWRCATWGVLPSTPALDAVSVPTSALPPTPPPMPIVPLPRCPHCGKEALNFQFGHWSCVCGGWWTVAVAELPIVPPTDERGTLDERVSWLEARVRGLERPVGPIAPPLGEHVETLRERARIVALLRRAGGTGDGVSSTTLHDAANCIERGDR